MKKRNVNNQGHFFRATVCFFIVALCSFAVERRHISEIHQTAQELKRSANYLQNALKSKKPDAQTVIAKNPNLVKFNIATWPILRQKLQTLSLSGDSRDRLANEDLPKYRFIIFAYADEAAQKARKLQTSAARIQIASCF